MDLLRKILATLAIGLGLLFVASLLIHSNYTIERELLIKSEIGPVFEQINNVEHNIQWSAWKALDPEMKITYGPIKIGRGASYSWSGKKTGEGLFIITNSVENERIDTQLTFSSENEKATGYFSFKKVADGTLLLQGFRGHATGLVGRLKSIFGKMFLGKQFSKELQNIKAIVENAKKTSDKKED